MAETKKTTTAAKKPAAASSAKKPAAAPAKKPAASTATKKTPGASVSKASPAKKSNGKIYSTEGAAGKRVAAIIFWVLAVFCELVAIMNLSGKWYLPNFIDALPDNYMLYLIIFLVLDLIFLIIGSQFWKQANHIDPPSEKNKVLFFLQNQMGMIMAIVCFVPFIIMLLRNDKNNQGIKLDKKERNIVLAVAIATLLIGGLVSADWNPISEEEKTEAIIEHEMGDIYVTQYGHCYHYYDDCQSLTKSSPMVVTEMDWFQDMLGENEEISAIEAAINKGYTKSCSFCQKHFDAALEEAGEILEEVEEEIAE